MTQAERAAIIDEFGELARQIAAMKPTMDRHRLLQDQIQSWYADAPPEQSFVASGERYEVQVGPRAKRRRIIGMRRLFRFLGQARFLELASMPLEAIDRYVPADLHQQILLEERSGSRPVRAIARFFAIEKKAA